MTIHDIEKDAGLAYALRRLLGQATKGDAETFVTQSVGDDYRPILERVLARLTWRRTLSQNALLHVWFEEVAKFHGDRTMLDVKGELHREIGLPIRLQDDFFAFVWRRSGAGLSFENQCKLLASGALNVSSGMTTKQIKQYLDEVQRKYDALGLRLEVKGTA